MNPPIVVLIGFSTAGKSYYLDRIKAAYPDEFLYLDSDRFVSESFEGHIFNIFMSYGREKALEHIKNKEVEFLNLISSQLEKPALIAAGPFLVMRDGWDSFVTIKLPFIIHLEKSLITIYEGLLSRRLQQRDQLDTSNPNFGSWDDGVTTRLKGEVYEDISREEALGNISQHLRGTTRVYLQYRHHFANSDELKTDSQKTDELISLIVDTLNGSSPDLRLD